MHPVTGKAFDGNSWSANWSTPKAFIENKGQFTIPREAHAVVPVLYAADGNGSMIYFTASGVTFTFMEKTPKQNKAGEENEAKERKEGNAIVKKDIKYFEWEGANANVEVVAEDLTSDYFSYSFKQGQEERAINFVKGYKKLIYKNLYPNIDVEYVFHPDGGIKYSLILHPGADVSVVRMKYNDKISLENDGDVNISTKFGNIIDHAPLTFYCGNKDQVIDSRFVKTGKTISFQLENYDKSKTVIIDPWTQNPVLNNGKKIWETETDASGNVYIYGGDMPIKLLKYNSTGTLQWTFIPVSPTWDSTNYWIGGFITSPTGDSYMTTGSNGEIRKINTGGTQIWYNNPNALLSYEYWSLAFNCDLTKLVVGGSKMTSFFPTTTIRGTIMDINLGSGAVLTTKIVGYGAVLSFPPNIQEVSSICFAPNGNYYFLTLDTLGSINTALTTINFKVGTGYTFDYYIPGYGLGTKQPISAIRANSTAVYTLNGGAVEKRDLNTGAVTGTAVIPGGSYTNTAFGRKVNGNGGLDIDASGNVYVGSVNQVLKYDGNLNLLNTYPTSFAVYDVDVNSNGEIAACGFGGGNGYIQTINVSAGAQMPYTCVVSNLSATSTSTNVLCNGQCTGTASVTASGGTSPYTYAWLPSGGTAASASSLCANNYTCTITDNVGATVTQSFAITQPTAVTATQSQTNLSCNAICNGTAAVVASGGTPGYTYAWLPSGGNTANANSLCNGNYTCTITDANSCPITKTFSITQPTPISASATATSTGCSANTGSTTVTASGGTGILSYSWSPSGGTNATANNLSAGVYTVTVTDANGCTQTANANVTSTGGPTVGVQSTIDVTCFGGTNGSGTISASGNGPFTYMWLPSGGNAATAINLGSGTYSITVTDAGGCVSIQTLTITSPTQLLTTPTSTPATCGNTNGTADAVTSGGTGPYTYLWSNSASSATLTNIAGGTYSVTVTDANGCTAVGTIVVGNTGAPVVAVSSAVNVLCFGESTGSAGVNASAGSPPYTYSWSPIGGNAANASNLTAGTYTVSVTGSDGCIQTQTLTLTQPPTAVQSTSATVPENCSDGDGIASATASGGTPGYTYLWSNSSSNDTINSLSAGSYSVIVTDANGCTTSSTVVVTSTGTATANAGATVTIIAGQSTQLNGAGGVTYNWSPATGLSCTSCQNPIASPTITTIYTLTVTDANGCSATDTVTIFVDIVCGEVYVPNAFSPNGDHQNDVFFVRGACIKFMQFDIYNRWGEKVFSSTDPSAGWDGTWRGDACEAAVFNYVLRATLLDGTPVEKQGNISLVK